MDRGEVKEAKRKREREDGNMSGRAKSGREQEESATEADGE